MPNAWGIAFAGLPRDAVLAPAGPVAQAGAEIAAVLFAGGALVFVLVMALLARALVAPPAADERRLARRWIVGGGLVFPAVVLAALLAWVTLRADPLPPRDGAEPVIAINGRMWWWQVRYADPAGGPDIVAANEIHLPAGRPVTLGLSSADVIHALWLPALAGKLDLVPGRVQQLRLQVDRPGEFGGRCAEFCGTQHARMALRVVAHEPADYARWLAAQAEPAAAPADALARQGLALYRQQRCSGCHALRGLEPGADDAPDLTHVGSRRTLAAGALPAGRAALAAWIADPQVAKPGARMPSYHAIDASSAQALAAFLDQLK